VFVFIKMQIISPTVVIIIVHMILPSHTFVAAGSFTALGESLGDAAVSGVEGFIAGTAAAASLTSAVLDGASLIGSSINQISQSAPTARSCAIEIRNYHKDIELTEPHVFVERGYTQIPAAPEISPGFQEVCMFRKTYGPATGSYGVLTYKIDNVLIGKDKRPIIESSGITLTLMWGVPWAWDWNSNYQAVGISQTPVSVDYDLFHKMYYKSGNFIRKEAGKTIFLQEIVYGNIPLKITTTMNDESRATWIININ